MACSITYLLLLLCGFIQFFSSSGTPVPLSSGGSPSTPTTYHYCFQTHTPKGRYGPCTNEQPNPDDLTGGNVFSTPEECCAQVGMAGGFTMNRSGSRCSTCADILDMVPGGGGVPGIDDSTVVDGGWSDWDSWSDCSVTCGNGTKTKTRNCSNPAPQNGGANCSGQITKIKACNEGSCIVDGEWSLWGEWTSCSVSCEDGSRIRQRSCDSPTPQNGGQDCQGDDEESETCSGPICPIHGGFSEWGPWGSCEGSLVNECNGVGLKTRSRRCNNPTPSHNGDLCTGGLYNRVPCTSTESCPVNGEWGAWGAFSECSETCGVSSRIRQRQCDNPAPSNGGDQCVGSDTDSPQPCDGLPACPTQPAPGIAPAPTANAQGRMDCDGADCQDYGTEVMTTEDVVTVIVYTDTTTEATTADYGDYDDGTDELNSYSSS